METQTILRQRSSTHNLRVTMSKLHSCTCGSFKFYTTYSKAYCAICGLKQPGTLSVNTLIIEIPAPEIDDVVILSTTD